MPPKYPPTSEPTSSVASPVTASIVPAIGTPTYGSGGSFTILGKARIKAPPSDIMEILRNTSEWHLWSSFIPRIHNIRHSHESSPPEASPDTPTDEENYPIQEGYLEKGTTGTLDVYLSGNGLKPLARREKTVPIEVTVLDKLERDGKMMYRLCWRSTQFAKISLRSERVFELVDTEDGGTDYTCWETFGGAMSLAAKHVAGERMVDRMGDMAMDIKNYLEDQGEGLMEDSKKKRKGLECGPKKPRKPTKLSLRLADKRKQRKKPQSGTV